MTVPSQMSLRRIPDALHLHGARRIRERVGGADRHAHPSGGPVRHRVRAADRPCSRRWTCISASSRCPRPCRRSCAPGPSPRSSSRRCAPLAHRARPAAAGSGSGSISSLEHQPLSAAVSGAHAAAGPHGRRARGRGGRRDARRERPGVLRAAAGSDAGGARRPTTTCGSSACRPAWRRWSCSGCRRGWRARS